MEFTIKPKKFLCTNKSDNAPIFPLFSSINWAEPPAQLSQLFWALNTVGWNAQAREKLGGIAAVIAIFNLI